MKTVYIVVGIIISIVILFFIFNRIYRYNTIDKELEKKISKGAILLDVRTAFNITMVILKAVYIYH